jgi:hypothetical protein
MEANNPGAKKDERRFTIKFCPVNPRHQEAVRHLKGAGRRKASLIADALFFYFNGGHTGTEPPSNGNGITPPYASNVTETASRTTHEESIPTGTTENRTKTLPKKPETDFWDSISASVNSFFEE